MQFGQLNDLLPNLSFHATFEGRSISPAPKEEGDPFRGTPVLYAWEVLESEGLELHVTLGASVLLDRITVCVGSKTALTSAVLKTPDGAVLSAHRAETGKAITASEIDLECNVVTDGISIVLTGEFSDVEIREIRIYGVYGELSPLFPTPREESLGDSVPLSSFTTYGADTADGLRAGGILSEKLAELFSHSLLPTDGTPSIRFSEDVSIAPDGYTLSVLAGSVTVCASNLRGFVMGAESFVKLCDGNTVRTGTVKDAPFLPFRGVHLYLPALKSMDFARRLIRHLISPMGYNTVIVEIATGMEYESHPEINLAVADAMEKAQQGIWPPFPHGAVAEGTALPKAAIKEFVEYIRSFGIEVVPEVQSLGHVPYITLTYPELAEVEADENGDPIDTRTEDARPTRFYPHCYCPSNEKSYEILFDLLDEIIEVFEPREYVHMGHDEVYYMGLCPRCKTVPHAELFASDVNKIYAHLKEKGLKMMIWSDMLQPVTKYQTPAAIDKIPKDILCLDFIWYFHLDKDIETNLLAKGFRVAIGNLYSSHFPRYEHRIRQDGMIGGQISMWSRTTEEGLQKEGKLYDLFMTAEMLWSESYDHRLRLVYDRMISAKMPQLRESIKGIRYPSRVPGAVSVPLFESSEPFPPSRGSAPISLTVSEAGCRSLIFTYTMLRNRTRQPWKPCTEVGTYVLSYEDGTEERIPLTLGGTIAHWNRRHNEPLRPKLYRHNGYTASYETDAEESVTADGKPVTFYRLEHILPEGKRLCTVSLVEDPAFDAGIVLKRVEAVVTD